VSKSPTAHSAIAAACAGVSGNGLLRADGKTRAARPEPAPCVRSRRHPGIRACARRTDWPGRNRPPESEHCDRVEDDAFLGTDPGVFTSNGKSARVRPAQKRSLPDAVREHKGQSFVPWTVLEQYPFILAAADAARDVPRFGGDGRCPARRIGCKSHTGDASPSSLHTLEIDLDIRRHWRPPR
jgi:hypothetical protein